MKIKVSKPSKMVQKSRNSKRVLTLFLVVVIFLAYLPNSTSAYPLKNFFAPSKPRILSEAGAEAGSEESHSGEHHTPAVVHIITYALMALVVGSIMRLVHRKFSLPFFPLIIITGLLVGLFGRYISPIKDALDFAHEIDSHTFLLTFLPPIIFESAFNSDAYILWKSKWQLMLLAGPVALATAFTLGFALLYPFDYASSDTLNLYEALTIGAIISTTDPISVVPLLE